MRNGLQEISFLSSILITPTSTYTIIVYVEVNVINIVITSASPYTFIVKVEVDVFKIKDKIDISRQKPELSDRFRNR